MYSFTSLPFPNLTKQLSIFVFTAISIKLFKLKFKNMFDIVKCKGAQERSDRREMSEIWDSFRQFIHFVEFGYVPLISVPWVERTPEQFMAWVRKLSKSMYKIERLFANDPEFKLQVLSDGEERFNADIVQKELFNNFFDRLIC